MIREEEEQFLKNLENGLKLLNDIFKTTKAAGSDTIDGKDAFKLHATYGIPIEVTESLAADQNLRVDRSGFERRRWTSTARSRADHRGRRRLRHRPARYAQGGVSSRHRVPRLPDDARRRER